RGQPLLRSQSPSRETDSRHDLPDHRPHEDLNMIAALLPLAANALQAVTTSAPPAAATGGVGFGEVMAQASGEALTSLKTAESTSMAGIEGNASVQQVVDSVMSA